MSGAIYNRKVLDLMANFDQDFACRSLLRLPANSIKFRIVAVDLGLSGTSV